MATNLNFSWLCCAKTPEKRKYLEDVMPCKYKYKISSFKVVQESKIQSEVKFEAVLNVNVCQEEGIQQFLAEFEKSSLTSYNQLHGDSRKSKKMVVSGYRKCYHNIRKRSKSGSKADDIDTLADDKTAGKQTNCPAGINFKLGKKLGSQP